MRRICIYILLIVFLLSSTCSACGYSINGATSSSEKDFPSFKKEIGFSSDEFNWKYDFKTTEENIVKYADAIQAGNIYVDSSITEPYQCSINEINWDIVFTDSPGTFSLYLLALNPISYLTQAYYITEEPSYLVTAKNILEQWMAYKDTAKSKNNPYLWYDHGTAIRSNNIIYFLFAYIEQPQEDIDLSFCDAIMELLEEHGSHLSNPEEYFENHNHGIFQDQALIYLSFFFGNQEWLSLAKERLEAQEEYAFSDEMVHVENSPGYQIGVIELFYQIAEFLTSQNDSFGNDLYNDVSLSLEFMSWITKPNGFLAEVGDTNSQKETLTKKDYSVLKYNNNHLSYAATLGERGEQPDKLSAYYPHSGYYFGRSSWEASGYTDATWTMFKAGYLSRTHKHADDLSFMLYSKGYDILVDPGWYNYMSGNKYRDYFVSSHAHNTIIVDEKSYSPTVENSSKTGFFSLSSTDEWDEIIGYNNMYEDVQIDRHFVYGGDAIILIDDIKSSSVHEYSQLFQLSEYMNIESYNDSEIVASIGDSGYKLRIKQFASNPTLEVINGEDPDSAYGYLSRTMNDLEYINTLKWSIEGADVVFVTLITIEDSNGNVLVGKDKNLFSISEIEYDERSQTLSFSESDKGFEYTWTSRERPAFQYIEKAIASNTITFTNNIPEDTWNYAWYLIDMENAEVVERRSYTEENTVTFTIDEDGTYLVKAYMSSQNGEQRSSSVIAALEKKGDSIVDVTDSYPYLNLEYLGHHVQQIDEKTYDFVIDFNYSWNFSVAWYIYKDGGIYFSESTSNTNHRKYSFSEPGTYTVMYYLKTPNGDNEFWNFSEIVIK